MSRWSMTHLVRRFADGTVGLNDLSLRIDDGELLVIVGPSGSGKTTLLRLIAGLDEPTAGEIAKDGKDITRLPARDRNVAMVFQNPSLWPHFSVRGNLRFGPRFRQRLSIPQRWIDRLLRRTSGADQRATAAAIEKEIERIAGAMGIAQLLDRRPHQLSGGEAQRVAFARALVRNPSILLLDEPFASLDAPLRAQLRCDFAAWQKAFRVTTVFVTHDQTEALSLGGRIAVLHEGRIHQVGTADDVYDRPADLFVARFLGTPPMNCLPDRLFEKHALPVARPFIAGVRPHSIRLSRPEEETDEYVELHGALQSVERFESAKRAIIKVEDETIVAECKEAELAQASDPGSLWIPVGQIHFFDPATSRRILPAGESQT